MKDFVNPALLVLVVVLLLCGALVDDVSVASSLKVWSMVICETVVIVDFALGFARALTHRPSVAKMIWAVVFLMVGCCVFLLPRGEAVPDDPAEQEYREMLTAYRETGDAAAANEVGDTLLVVAASLGKKPVVQELLDKQPDPVMTARAMQRAAENGHLPVVKLLLPKVDINAVSEGTTPLIVAASAGRKKIVEYLLKNGANPDLPDETGSTALIQAVRADAAPIVKLLLAHGADPSLKDSSDNDAASYSRSEEIDLLLQK